MTLTSFHCFPLCSSSYPNPHQETNGSAKAADSWSGRPEPLTRRQVLNPQMVTGLNKPILQHSRAGKGGGSVLGGWGFYSSRDQSRHRPFPTRKSGNPATPKPPRFEQLGSAEDMPDGFGKSQKRSPKYVINLSQEECPITWKLFSFIMPGFPDLLSQVSLANISTKLSKYRYYQYFKERLLYPFAFVSFF